MKAQAEKWRYKIKGTRARCGAPYVRKWPADGSRLGKSYFSM